MGYMDLKINNSRKAAIPISKSRKISGQWKDPGAKLYNQLLDAQHIVGNHVPDGSKEFQKIVKEGKYLTWQNYLEEAYMVAPVKDIKNSPHGVTPFSRSGCKYPHHVIKKGELVVSIPGLRAAYICARNQGVLVNHTLENKKIVAHFNRHFKELGLKPEWHYGEFYLIDEAAETIENNFMSIYEFIDSKLATDLIGSEHDLEYLSEKSHGDLKYDYRIGIDINTGRQVAVQFVLGPTKITTAGNRMYYTNAYLDKHPEDNHMVNKIYGKIIELNRSGETDEADKLKKKLDDKVDRLIRPDVNKAVNFLKDNIRKIGNIDHVTDELLVDKIFLRNGQSLKSVELIPSFDKRFNGFLDHLGAYLRANGNGSLNNYLMGTPSNYKGRNVAFIDIKKMFDDPKVQSIFVEWCKSNNIHGEKYEVGKLGGKDKYKTTKLTWNMHYDMHKFGETPAVRGYNKHDVATVDDNKYNGNNKPKYVLESAMSDEAVILTSEVFDEIGRTPEKVYQWMHDNIMFDDETTDWKLRNPSDVYLDKRGNCHDQSLFESLLFHSLNVVNGQLFFIEFRNDGSIGGRTHTLTWFRKGGNGYSDFKEPYDDSKSYHGPYEYFWLENAWESQSGIHGPYSDLDELKKVIFEACKKDHTEEFDGVVFSTLSNYRGGMSLDEYVKSWRLEDDHLFNESEESYNMDFKCNECNKVTKNAAIIIDKHLDVKRINKLHPNWDTEYGKVGHIVCPYCHTRNDVIINNKEIIRESLDWIHKFVNDDEFRESVYVESNHGELKTELSLEDFNHLEDPIDLYKFMEPIQYGWIAKDGEVYGTGDNDSSKLFFDEYRLQSPIGLMKTKVGVCWDQVELERKWFIKKRIPHIIVYIEISNNSDCPSHTFLVYKDEGESKEVYWFEHSWVQMAGIHKYKDFDTCIADVTQKFINSNDAEGSLIIRKLSSPMKRGMTCQEYMDAAHNEFEIDIHDIHYDDLFGESTEFDESSEELSKEYSINELPDKMYFGTPNEITGKTISVISSRGLFLTPFMGIASMFIIDRFKECRNYLKDILAKDNMKLIGSNYNIDYEEWYKPDSELTSPLQMVHMYHNIPEFTEIKNGSSEGYIYQIDVSGIKHELQTYVTNNANREVVYKGTAELPITDSIHHVTNWSLSYKSNGSRGTFETRPISESVDTDEAGEESMPKKIDNTESDKNGVRRKKLYIAFIEWCKSYNNKNVFGSIFDKDIFKTTFQFVPNEMRYFYRLANPILCVLGGQLTFFQASELKSLNEDNPNMNELLIFAATPTDMRVFNTVDKKVYLATEEDGQIKLDRVLGDTFDLYIQNMINQGDILNGPVEESVEYFDLA